MTVRLDADTSTLTTQQLAQTLAETSAQIAVALAATADTMGPATQVGGLIPAVAQVLPLDQQAPVDITRLLAEAQENDRDDVYTQALTAAMRLRDAIAAQEAAALRQQEMLAIVAAQREQAMELANALASRAPEGAQSTARLAADALVELAATYDLGTAAEIAPALAYWSTIAANELAAPQPPQPPAPSTPTVVPLIGQPFFGVGDVGANGQGGTYAWLPAAVASQAQTSSGGYALLASGEQVISVQDHLDAHAMVFVERRVPEARDFGDGATLMVDVVRNVPVPAAQAIAELGLSGTAAVAYAQEHRAYMLPDGNIADFASFTSLARRPPSDADRVYIGGAPEVRGGGEAGESINPARYVGEEAYLRHIGLPTDVPRNLTIAFNNSTSGSGDVHFDESHRDFDPLRLNAAPERAYHAIVDDALAGRWVQIGDIGPLEDDMASLLSNLFEHVGAKTPEQQENVRNGLFRYEANYGVLAARELVDAAVEMNENRRQGFFESGVGRALVVVAATLVGGPPAAAAVSAGYTIADGGTFLDALRAGVAGYAGAVIGADAGAAAGQAASAAGASTFTSTVIAGATQGGSSSVVNQAIATGRVDWDAVAAAAFGGGVSAAANLGLRGSSVVSSIDQTLGLRPGTTAQLISGQAGSFAATGDFDVSGGLLTVGNGALAPATAGPQPASITVRETDGGLPAIVGMLDELRQNPNIYAEGRQTENGHALDIRVPDGTRVTYVFEGGELRETQVNRALVESGVGANMQRVRAMADELRANPNLEVFTTNNYRTGLQQIMVQGDGQPAVRYSFQDGDLVSVTYPDQLRGTMARVYASQQWGVPVDIAQVWADRAVSGQALIASEMPSDVLAAGRVATVPIYTAEPGRPGADLAAGFLAVATIDGVDRPVLVTANHAARLGETTTLYARNSVGERVEIPFDGQTAVSTGSVDEGGRINMDRSASSDGLIVTLSPETLATLRPGVTLSELPRVGGTPEPGVPLYQFGYAAYGNVDVSGQYVGMNLVGTIGTSGPSVDGASSSTAVVSASNPPITGGMSGGPVLVRLPDGSVRVVGLTSMSGAAPNPATSNTPGMATTTSWFTALAWLLRSPAPPR